jgi:hypothetical protein
MAAPVVGAINQEAAHTGRSYFTERDFLMAAFCGSAAGKGGHAPLKRSNGGQAIAPRFSSALASRGQDSSPHHASQPFAPSNADHRMREFISSEAVQIVVCRKPNWDRYWLHSEDKMSRCSHQQMTNHHDSGL